MVAVKIREMTESDVDIDRWMKLLAHNGQTIRITPLRIALHVMITTGILNTRMITREILAQVAEW